MYFPSLAASAAGRVYAAWDNGSRGLYLGNSRICLATYDGHSWTGPVAVTDTGNRDYDPALATDTLGRLHLLWGRDNTGEVLYQSFDGHSWSTPPVNVSESPGRSYFPAPAIDHANHLQVVWQDLSLGNPHIFYRSFDGAQWSEVENLSDSSSADIVPHLAVGAQNDLHLVFIRMPLPRTDQDVLYRRRHSGQWESPVDLDSLRTQNSYDCDVAVDRENHPWVLWSQGLDPVATPPLRLILESTFDGSIWTLPAPISDSTEAQYPRLTYDSRRDILHAVWTLFYRNKQLDRLLYSYRANGQWHQPEVILGPLPLGTQPALCLDSAGCCHVAFACNDSGLYYVRQQVPVGVREQSYIGPRSFALEQNYPNPFNGQTNISYSIEKPGQVRLRVCDLLGREVRVLIDRNEPMAGRFSVRFDATGLSSGVYFYEFQSLNQRLVRRMLLVR